MSMKFQSGNKVVAIEVTAPGSGFTVRPTVSIANAPAGGTNAQATAVGIIVSAEVANGGSGYQVGDILTVAGGAGSSAKLRVESLLSAGEIDEVSIVDPGAYTTLPTLTENAVETDGEGEGATVNLVVGCGPVTVTEPGLGYLTAPAVTIGGTGGSGAQAVAVMDDPNYDVSYSRQTHVKTTVRLSRQKLGVPTVDLKVWGEGEL